MFEFLSRGQISRTHPDLKGFREDSCLERFSATPHDPANYTHSLRLDSAVEMCNIPFTNYTSVCFEDVGKKQVFHLERYLIWRFLTMSV